MEIDDASRNAERRREPRTQASRSAQFMLANHPERGWGACRISDFSRTGAGLVLFGPPWPRYPSEQRLLVRITDGVVRDQSVAPLEVVIRNSTATEEGWLRVGVEFAAPDADQQRTAFEWVRALRSDV